MANKTSVTRKAILLLTLGCSILLCACHKETFPPLLNAPNLRADAIRLLDDPSLGDIPKSQWPPSIKALNPLSVTRESDNIKILLYHERGKFSGGYHVYRDTKHSPSTQGVWVQKSGFDG